jgi:hypothetical protein
MGWRSDLGGAPAACRSLVVYDVLMVDEHVKPADLSTMC